ncbi:hypothetical protein EVAR_15764_1 [Eumeta japonica]|uniref:Uncharacterized protein n=1 Tax=Eumeta variegata TaxID=151549 RepID=A0A4C1U0S6_EUMVA|nr:hypothetical protein EVAR_15764_1 [Eumeta japonica]
MYVHSGCAAGTANDLREQASHLLSCGDNSFDAARLTTNLHMAILLYSYFASREMAVAMEVLRSDRRTRAALRNGSSAEAGPASAIAAALTSVLLNLHPRSSPRD